MVTWLAVIVFYIGGEPHVISSPLTFDNFINCKAYVTRSADKFPEDIPLKAFCLRTIHGKDA